MDNRLSELNSFNNLGEKEMLEIQGGGPVTTIVLALPATGLAAWQLGKTIGNGIMDVVDKVRK